MINYFKNYINEKSLSQKFFDLGIFLLPSAVPISIFLLIISSINSYLKSGRDFLRDKWNIPFLIAALLIILGAVVNTFYHNSQAIIENHIFWLGIANWIPLFLIFWGIQPYLKSKSQRKNCSIILISGSLPVILTGIGQYFFNWTGPFSTLNGLIVWYQRPIQFPGGLTALFNHANYAGSWLNIIWPFILASFLNNQKNLLRKSIIITFLASISLSIILTNSRNAWISLVNSSLLFLGIKSLIFTLFILFIFLALMIICNSKSFEGPIQTFAKSIIPENVWMEFSELGFQGLDITRLEIWQITLNLILKRPLIGYGASTFSFIFLSESNLWKGHSHNLPLEIAFSFGIPTAIIICITIIFILLLAFRKTFLKGDRKNEYFFYEKAWVSSLIVLVLSQLVDIQYFDGRISLAFWILLAGSRNIISE